MIVLLNRSAVIDRTEFLARCLKALEMQKGLAYGAACNIDGEVDAIGAYGYCFDHDCQEAVDSLVAFRNTLSTDAKAKLAAAASERATEVIYGDAGASRMIRGLIVLNDLRGGGETAKGRHTRVLTAIKLGQLLEVDGEAA